MERQSTEPTLAVGINYQTKFRRQTSTAEVRSVLKPGRISRDHNQQRVIGVSTVSLSHMGVDCPKMPLAWIQFMLRSYRVALRTEHP